VAEDEEPDADDTEDEVGGDADEDAGRDVDDDGGRLEKAMSGEEYASSWRACE